MRIVEDLLLYELLEVIAVKLPAERLVCVELPQRDERIALIVQPRVKYIDAIHKSFRICGVIRFPELEFHVVNAGEKRLPVDTFADLFL